MSAGPEPEKALNLRAVVLRIILLLCLVVAGTWIAHLLKEALDLQIRPSNEQQVHSMLMMGLGLYVVLLAIPFVPGAEVGIAMLTAFGAAIVPMVYLATVLAMTLAFLIGGLMPVTVLARGLSVMRLHRASDLVTRASVLERDERLALLLEHAPAGAASLALRHRYLALAVAVNVPGNSVIGGGGGIMMMAGLSGVFAPIPTILAIVIGVSPIPVAILLFGA